jgi:hypothetical protein
MNFSFVKIGPRYLATTKVLKKLIIILQIDEVAILSTNNFNHTLHTLGNSFYWVPKIWFTMGLHCQSTLPSVPLIINIYKILETSFTININLRHSRFNIIIDEILFYFCFLIDLVFNAWIGQVAMVISVMEELQWQEVQ